MPFSTHNTAIQYIGLTLRISKAEIEIAVSVREI